MTELPRPPPFTRSVALGVLRNIDQVEGGGLDALSRQFTRKVIESFRIRDWRMKLSAFGAKRSVD